MQRAMLGLLCLVALTLSACAAKDPVQTILSEYNMSVVKPPRTGMTLGEIYMSPNLNDPITSASSIDAKVIKAIMKDAEKEASLPSASLSKSYALDASATYIGDNAATLKRMGASSYSVTFRNPKLYILTLDNLMSSLLPALSKPAQNLIMNEQYYISSLLLVDGMEYTFKDSSGASVKLGTELDKVAGKLEAKADRTKEGTLIFDAPRFIGYSMRKLTITQAPEGAGDAVWAGVGGVTSQITMRTATTPEDTARGAEVVIAEVALSAGGSSPARGIALAPRSPGATEPAAVTRYVIEARDLTPEELKQSR
ncbi:hypothetical protein GKC30_05685 [Pseudodesulfovibrio sp. F-1]|uniref:DUF4292 domain-containing protein n=1 Tax=Pseudodesulfovibrio alkaliphilus TaxID=2661613 RepID=A0A7K1KM01_9BACT|nr:hypothetical protein [Pseudodesulfovibrio alkaliphilus]MUM77118.1 hypothetical protein [Pseudodesulfovibrio alkaliphilus]